MYHIKINDESKQILGYYCGIFNRQGTNMCGYEDNVDNPKVKHYKLRRNAERTVETLFLMYGNTSYTFEIIQEEN